jgi:4a-hydroxytetrahydrobiopterin dehydratase
MKESLLSLNKEGCQPCRAGAPKSTEQEIDEYLNGLDGWELDTSTSVLKISKTFIFSKYAESLSFVNKVAVCSEEEEHHPVMLFEFRQVTVQWWTHKIEGLHLNDFIMASKCDALYANLSVRLP